MTKSPSRLVATIVLLSAAFNVASSVAPNKAYWDYFDVLRICNSGTNQSPINIIERDTELATTPSKIVFVGYENPLDFEMKNDGTTAKFSLKNPSGAPTITAPHLKGDTFKFAQFHFHWGGENKVGSEHLLSGIASPIEVHLVHFNTKYGSTIEDALAMKGVNDNLAVLGVFFDIIPCSVTAFDSFINKLSTIVDKGSKTDVTGLKLVDLLPLDTETFFSYDGSLTTPRCQEIVSWTVFKHKNFLAQSQLEEFRKLKNSLKMPLVNNYRSVTALNKRKVKMYQNSA
uniref:carbonic anhydrase n=1 Tax=Caligus rogercresseyi TaxID=217165 RepID=C1BP42_CALRO|nr:carbonic anhydrase 3 [Caligus rogercresseyi]